MAKTVCKILGIVFLFLGVAGFAAPNLLGAHLNPEHNLVHIVSGVIGLYFGFAGSLSGSRGFCLVFGIVYLVLGVLGLVIGSAAMNGIWQVGPLHLGIVDHGINVLIGVVFLAGGLFTKAHYRPGYAEVSSGQVHRDASARFVSKTSTRPLAADKEQTRLELPESPWEVDEASKALAVFISAKSADYTFAMEIYRFLTSRGVSTFLSQETLPELGNADYRKEIDRALENAKHMVVVTSSVDNVMSTWVEAEWGFFVNEKRSGRKSGNLITVVVGGLKPGDLPASLRYYEVIPFQPEEFEKILRYVR